MPDAPGGAPEVSGGKMAGDPGMEGATENAGASVGSPGGDPDDSSSHELPGEKHGGGGGTGGG